MEEIKRYFSEEIISNRINNVDKKNIQEKMIFSPYRVEIQPTTFCNRVCAFCSHSIRNQTGNEIPEKIVLEIIDQLHKKSCKHVSFSGGGEPFEWHKGDIGKVIKYAAEKMNVTITTNGDGFWNDFEDKPQNLQIAKYCSNIIINTPEVDDRRYKGFVQGKCSWSKTQKIIHALQEEINQNTYQCDICCVVVVSKLNYHFLCEIDCELQKLGVDRVYYKLIKTFEDNDMHELAVSNEELIHVRNIIPATSSNWLKTFLNSVASIEKYYSQKCWSNEIGMNAIIDPNGDVFICTPTVGVKNYVLGNILNNDFMDLWETPERIDLIDCLNYAHCNGKCPKECRLNSHNTMIENYLFNKKDSERIIMNAGIDDIIR